MTVENAASHAARIVENVLLNQVKIQSNIYYCTAAVSCSSVMAMLGGVNPCIFV